MTYYHRHLPHWQPSNVDIFITWRLHGSLPAHLRPPKSVAYSGKQFVDFDKQLDQAHTGPLWLKDPRVAVCVLSQLNDLQHRKRLRLRSYAIMANHVHVLLTPFAPIDQITRLAKGVTARHANLILNRTGTAFWQDESFDHWVRTPAEAKRISTYIERNPVDAGLVKTPEDWPWSSASSRTGFSLSGLDPSPPKL